MLSWVEHDKSFITSGPECFHQVRGYLQEMPQSHTADQHTAARGRYTEHLQPDESKGTLKTPNSLATSARITAAKLERQSSNACQNKDQTQGHSQ